MILNRIQNFLRRLHPSTEFQNFTNNNNYINFSVILDSKVHNSCFFLFRPITINLHHKMSNEASGTNRLSLEKSPYLLQHSTNPVDWYPWGEEAFKKAQDENKLIFLSVGYSTCHWCHVMEKESFENVEVAEIMNKYFVNIKVDREERPDVDKIYMSFIQASYGSGGWPMSIFLTPNLEPVAGGTYFPPNDRYGQFGFKTVLENLADKWINKPNTLIKVGDQYIKSLQKSVDDAKSKFVKQIRIPRLDVEQRCLIQYSYAYDKQYGGFSSSPKFPQPSNFNLLFHIYSKSKHSEQGKECLKMCLFTLKKMAYGGIHDHVNSGFARYSVDRKWHIPHFEKMLYDQAQLAVSYADAYVLTKDEFYADTLNDILKYVSRDLSHPEGGFYGAEDADSYSSLNTSKKQEGAFCIWEYDEIVDVLSARNFKIFEYHFNLKKTGNVDPSQDTHGEFVKKNVLACFKSYKDTAEKFQIDINDVKKILKECLGILYELRQKRPKPQVDTKILTSWNGLMISGYSKAGFILKNQSYIDRAIKAANFLRNNLCMEDDKLLRCCYGGEDGQVNYGRLKINGFLEDYAFLIRGLLDLYEACLDVNWLIWAEKLQEKQDQLFWDKENWGYFHWNSENYPNIVFTTKDYQDGAEPCGNSVSVHNLLKLSAYLDRNDFMLKASQTLTAFSERLTTIPIALPEMVSALLFYHNSPTQVFIAGKREDDNTEALLDVVRSKFMPGRILAVADELAGFLQQRHQTLARLKTIGGKSAAYVCRNFTCSLPVTEPEELSNYFDKNEFHKTN